MINKIKTYAIIILGIIILVLSLLSISMILKIDSLEEDLSKSINNNKAYENTNIQFQYTVKQLEQSKDSLIKEMIKVRDSLGISKKKVTELMYFKEYFRTTDTLLLYIHDSIPIFTSGVAIDTTIGDDYYNANIHLEYPNIVVFEPSFKSELYIISNLKRETINPPRKFFLFRWFQKKHNLIETSVVNKNPYCVSDTMKTIKIVK